jgi:hypothetical protein
MVATPSAGSRSAATVESIRAKPATTATGTIETIARMVVKKLAAAMGSWPSRARNATTPTRSTPTAV